MTEAFNGLRLLVVEDEMMVAMMLEDLLGDLGCVVAGVAGTLERGLEWAADPMFALDGAILDVNLGGEKAYPIAEALTARGVPFLFATGYGAAGVAEAFSGVPALTKPYNQDDLKAMLSAVFKRPE